MKLITKDLREEFKANTHFIILIKVDSSEKAKLKVLKIMIDIDDYLNLF
jgi:hypothetical protein